VAKLGYKNIQVYSEGIPGWVKAGFPLDKAIPRPEIPPLAPSQLQEKLGDAYLLDIRFEGLYKQGHIKGSRNIPIHLITRRFQEIPTGKRIIIIDLPGNPAWVPIGWFLKSKGYNDVMMLKGGMNAWQKEGLPLEK
jgi:rhodanese-related sulfurtransferase